MVIPTQVILPIRDQVDLCANALTQLRAETWDRLWIFDNGSVEQPTLAWLDEARGVPGARVIPAAGRGIYDMWAEGVKISRHWASGPTNIAVLNNDIQMLPGTLTALATALRENDTTWVTYPNYDRDLEAGYDPALGLRETSGTFRLGGMSGFCFMLRGEQLDWHPLIDPQFEWWGGDDDLAFEIERHGGAQVRVEGLPVWHMSEGTARHHEITSRGSDLQRVVTKWGR